MKVSLSWLLLRKHGTYIISVFFTKINWKLFTCNASNPFYLNTPSIFNIIYIQRILKNSTDKLRVIIDFKKMLNCLKHGSQTTHLIKNTWRIILTQFYLIVKIFKTEMLYWDWKLKCYIEKLLRDIVTFVVSMITWRK